MLQKFYYLFAGSAGIVAVILGAFAAWDRLVSTLGVLIAVLAAAFAAIVAAITGIVILWYLLRRKRQSQTNSNPPPALPLEPSLPEPPDQSRTLVTLDKNFRRSDRFLPQHRIQLPFAFINRSSGHDRYLEQQVEERIKEESVVVWGAGGVGKSALAAFAFVRAHPSFSGGSLWLTADGRTLDSFLTELSILLDCRGEADLEAAVHSRLASLGNCLLAVDNLESARSDVLDFLEKKLPITCRLLATSRHQADSLGSSFFLGPMTKLESEQLLRQLARPQRGPNPLSPEGFKGIVQAARGNPKAIELLLGQVENRGYRDPLEEMKGGQGKVIEDIVGRSFALLKPEVQQTLCALSLFSPWALKTFLAGVMGMTVQELEPRLAELWRWRLAERDDEGDRWWAGVQEGVYARARSKADDFRPAFAKAFLDIAISCVRYEDQARAYAILEEQHENLFSAMDWCAAQVGREGEEGKEAAQGLVTFTDALQDFLTVRGYWAQRIAYGEKALAAAQRLGDQDDVARVGGNLATAYRQRGDPRKAGDAYRTALKTFEKSGAKQQQAQVLHLLGTLAQGQGDLQEAQRLYQESLALARELGDKQGIASTLHQLGRLAQDRGDLPGAQRLYQESLALERELGDKQGIASTLHQLGMMAQDRGDLPEADRLYQESLALKRELGDKQGIAQTLHQLGRLAQDRGDLPEAHRLYQESLALKRELGAKQGIASTLHQLGIMAQHRGDLPEADRLYQQALTASEELGAKREKASVLAQMGLLLERQERLQEAAAHLLEALVLFKELGSPTAQQAEQVLDRVQGKLRQVKA